MARARMANHNTCMTSAAEVSAATNLMTATVPRASHMTGANMTSPAMPAAVTGMSSVASAHVPARMSAPAVPASMSTAMPAAMLRENWVRKENADARAQQDGEPDCESLFPSARNDPGSHAGLRLHN